jgi:hypothetical protein
MKAPHYKAIGQTLGQKSLHRFPARTPLGQLPLLSPPPSLFSPITFKQCIRKGSVIFFISFALSLLSSSDLFQCQVLHRATKGRVSGADHTRVKSQFPHLHTYLDK